MARTLVIANQKGGVGKTTTTVNLSAALALAEKKTLLVDFDPQANSTSSFGIHLERDDQCIYEVLMGNLSFGEAVKDTNYPYLWIMPSHIRLVGAEIELVGFDERERVLSRKLDRVRDEYDYILIDCPPSLGLLTLNGLTAADAVLIPIQAEYFALEGLTQLLQTIRTIQKRLNPALQIEGIVLTMFDPRLNLAKQVREELRKFFPSHLFDSEVNRNVRLAEAPSFGRPVMHFAVKSQGTKDYLALAEQIISKEEN